MEWIRIFTGTADFPAFSGPFEGGKTLFERGSHDLQFPLIPGFELRDPTLSGSLLRDHLR